MSQSIEKAQMINIDELALEEYVPVDVEMLEVPLPDSIIVDVRHSAEQERKPLQLPGQVIEHIPFYALQTKFQELANTEEYLLCITENGYGKLSSAYEYRITNRGGSGVTNITVTPKNGRVVQSLKVSAEDNIALISDNGKLLRCNVGENIRVVGRVSQGVSVFKVDKNEKIVAVARLEENGDDD